ncbi:FbpB family small basic protein [Neobacillus sp. NRS-1170]
MRKTKKMSFIELVEANKKKLLNNVEEIERIEKRIEQRHEIKRYKQK